jgi:hypothetical protein
MMNTNFPGDAYALTIDYTDAIGIKRDLRSKSIFSFLMFIFSLTETGGKEGAPIITVPVG